MKRKWTERWALWALAACAVLITAAAAAKWAGWFPAGKHVQVASLSQKTIIAGEPAPLDNVPVVPESPAALSKRLVEYHISVSLDPDKKELQGTQSVTWENPGSRPVSELYFHLYPNAFESDKTTFNRESGGKLRQDEKKPNNTGNMTVTGIRSEQGEDLSRLTEFVRPDDGNSQDHTLMKLRLLTPVPAGGKITLNLDFLVKLPFVYARMGYADDNFYMAGQWFPKIAVYEPAGTRGRTEEGWNLHQYHGNSEFYADFGIYDVKIKVPAGYTVAATGFPSKIQAGPSSTKIYRYYADDVHDFAWAASPHFIYYEESFSAPQIPGVKIKLYLDPAHKDLKNRYLLAAKKALTRYSEWYGAYPYSTLSIVVPPAGGNGAGGMEYPTLITAWAADDKQPSLELERVIVHEIGHQWWYGMVASNEFEEAWLDEGFTSYAEDMVMQKEYGSASILPLEASYVTSPEPLKKLSWDYGSHSVYADNVYTRAKLVLNAIERQAGEPAMKKILRTYFQKWKFRHPSTEDFQRTVESVTGQSWSDFFNQYVYNGLMSDYSVDGIRINKKTVDGATVYDSRVLIRKLGGQTSAVPVRFHFKDGSTKDEMGDGKASEVQYKFNGSSPVDWVQIDPKHTLVLENRHMNNYLKAEADPVWSVRLNTGVHKILEALISWVAW
ncbi:M1 family metallopeptidase [Gorillibacterium massiliense]|uniref:M1 family metallopeptidase n=1 Tax=Gorillibacterium massiliense TaxID=1280390 RepID=UPI0004BAA128|nr:M1 family metallopeptidase [Gorillibacterium massiliense]